jgi:hypothetical protein
MEHGQPVLDYSESDLEVPEPIRRDFRLGDLVILRSSVRFEKGGRVRGMLKAARQIGKTHLVQRLMDMMKQPEVDEVGIVIKLDPADRSFVDILWCRRLDIVYNSIDELSIVQRRPKVCRPQ